MLDSKAAAKAQAASPARAISLDGALDSTDLQSFAFQIANGMVKLYFPFQIIKVNFYFIHKTFFYFFFVKGVSCRQRNSPPRFGGEKHSRRGRESA